MSDTLLPARYDAMCRAIDAGEAISLFSKAEHCPSSDYPDCPGVYVFDGIKRVLYVGESKNIRRRLKKHERGYLRRSIGVRCLIIPCANHKQVESWLIIALCPSMNGVSEQRMWREAALGSADRLEAHWSSKRSAA